MSTSIDMSNNVILDEEPANMITENEPLQDNLNKEEQDNSSALDTLFSMDLTTMLMVFAGVVIVLYLLLGRLFGSSSNESPVNGFIGKMVDIVIFGLLIFGGMFYYNS